MKPLEPKSARTRFKDQFISPIIEVQSVRIVFDCSSQVLSVHDMSLKKPQVAVMPHKNMRINIGLLSSLPFIFFSFLIVCSYSCETCSETFQCCTTYERCVSCCLGQKYNINILKKGRAVTEGQVFQFVEVADIFDYCSLRCRTSSSSVVHQNTFRSDLKHCYGQTEPPLL